MCVSHISCTYLYSIVNHPDFISFDIMNVVDLVSTFTIESCDYLSRFIECSNQISKSLQTKLETWYSMPFDRSKGKDKGVLLQHSLSLYAKPMFLCACVSSDGFIWFGVLVHSKTYLIDGFGCICVQRPAKHNVQFPFYVFYILDTCIFEATKVTVTQLVSGYC